tara:strand:- start:2646 stop:3515 length:870 start_codon:yes stop_codon:yes gene_type:complete
MLCDGREISIEENQGLYDLIGTTYGAGDSAFWAQVFYPATTFNIPDLRGRTIIGSNDMGGEQSDVLTIHQASSGQVGGEEMHQLTEEEMPSHGHVVSGYVMFSNGGSQYGDIGLGDPLSPNNPTPVEELTDIVGNDIPHNNMQPYIALNYMMKVQAAEDVVSELSTRIGALEDELSVQSVWDTLFFTGCNSEINFEINSSVVDFLVVQGATFGENTVIHGCDENQYSLFLDPCQGCPNGHVLTVISDLQGTLAPFLKIFSPSETHDQWGGRFALEYVWAGDKWYKLSVD